ncbi:MAG: hypothetical protein DSZ06_04830 [Sulfurospirillum sp.]|nr:MAG: hypothetical protein DSZ06_04830 [Sulfurospirillum sp.]
MKRVLSKSFVWSIILLEIALVIGAFIIYFASSQKSLDYLATTLLKDKNITYSSISGSILESIKIEKPRYKNYLIADSADISWNFKSLLKKRVSISSINIDNLNLMSIEKLLENSKTKKHSKKSSLSLDIDIDKIKVSTLPYINRYINLKALTLKAKKIHFKDQNLSIKQFNVDALSNLAKLQIYGSLDSDTLKIDNLNLQDIDIKTISELISSIKATKSKKKSDIPIKRVLITKANLSILPLKIGKERIDKAVLTISNLDSNIDSNISKVVLNAKTISLIGTTTLAKLKLDANIKKNHLFGKSTLNLNHKRLNADIKIINFKNLNPINLTIFANLKGIDSNISLKTPSLFASKFKNYKVKINHLLSRVHYKFSTNILKAHTDANLTTPYAKELIADNYLILEQNRTLSYKGKLYSKHFRKLPKKFLPLLEDAKAVYFGDKDRLIADLNTSTFNLKYHMQNFKSAKFLLHSKELNVSSIFDLPKELKELKATVDGKMDLDFKSPKLIIGTNIKSNALNAKGVIDFKDGFRLKAKTKLVKNSILSNIDKNLKLDSIFPSDLNLSIKKKKLFLSNIGTNLKIHLLYDLNSSFLDMKTSIKDEAFILKGDKNRLIFHTKIISLKEAQKKLESVYNFKAVPIDGEIDLNCTISDYSKIDGNLKSRWFVYEYEKNKFAFAEKIDINFHKIANDLTIESYKLSPFIANDNRYFFSNKPSLINIDKEKINIKSFWINDTLKNSGFYNISQKKGEIKSYSDGFNYKGKEGDFLLKIDLLTRIDPNQTSIKGKITVLKALITYKYKKNYEIDDPDIIIIQDRKKKESSKKSKSNLIIDIAINSLKPLKYKTDNIDIEFLPEGKLWKERQKSLELLGRVALLRGKYIEHDKEFKILPSELLFGGDIRNPYLSIKAKYYANPYEITIDITGRLDSPIINFSSNPFLSQSDILSLLLFDSTSDSLLSSKGNSSNMAISFFGSTFAKEIVKNFGIKLDKLIVTTNEEGNLGFEIGKKISKKVTIIYINDIVQTIKIKYQHSDHFETDLTLSPQSSGIDFIFKKEH